MAILVCGGAGYIGSHINKELHKEGYETIVFDSLIYGHREAVKWGTFVEGDLSSLKDLEKVFSTYDIEVVFHFAAFAYVGESVEQPEKYYYNNVVNTLNLLQVMKKHGCKRIIFSSTCATYGEPERVPITEEMPQHPINPYGATKLMVERIFKDYHRAYGLEYVVLRYFNVAGCDPEGEIGESHDPETHIIPLVLDAAGGQRPDIKHFEFGKGAPDKTVITKEYSCEWKQGDEPYYPVNDEANTAVYQKYCDLAANETAVSFGGRLGTYRYMDMDKVIAMALKDAEHEKD